ncbi:MAG: mycoredoxin [Actinomycetales bacterium]|jgi:mycoredoxin|nr:mycoredoxin [Actinomycetales bacterium]
MSDASLVTVYTTTWCGPCKRLKAQMGRAGVQYTEVDIEADPTAAAFVASVNGGNEMVPTLKFSDGSTLTNPPIAEVIAKLAA